MMSPFGKNNPFLTSLLAVVIAAALITASEDCWARAGGGHSSSHFSGGGSHSSGGTSGSFGGSSSGFSHGSYGGASGCLLPGLFLGSLFPFSFIFLIIMAIVAFAVLRAVMRASRLGRDQFEGPPTPIPSYQPIGEREAAAGYSSVDALKAKDPHFSEQAFLDKAQMVFFELQKGWMKRDLNTVRPYVTDAVFNRWQVLIDQYKSDRQINVIKDPVINNARIVRVQEDSDLDSITVRLDASMADAMVSEDDPKKILSGSLTQHSPFTEYWTFVRKGVVKTDSGASVHMDKCPNCGAPLKISAAGSCEYCATLVHSPQYDWVLNQITQAEEWV